MKIAVIYFVLTCAPLGAMMYFLLTGRKRKPWKTIAWAIAMILLCWACGGGYLWYVIKNATT